MGRTTKDYRYVGVHADGLANGRPVEPGEFVSLTDEDIRDPYNARLIEEGLLISVDAPSKGEES